MQVPAYAPSRLRRELCAKSVVSSIGADSDARVSKIGLEAADGKGESEEIIPRVGTHAGRSLIDAAVVSPLPAPPRAPLPPWY